MSLDSGGFWLPFGSVLKARTPPGFPLGPPPMSHDEQSILCIANCWDPQIVLMFPLYSSVSPTPSAVPDTGCAHSLYL